MQTLACRVQILSEELHHERVVRDIRLGGYGRENSAQLRLAYRFKSEKLLNPANQQDPFYALKTDISKTHSFSRGNVKKLEYVGGP
jgi:hypothetical protein